MRGLPSSKQQCPLCQSGNPSCQFESAGSKGHFVAGCSSCGLRWTEPPLSERELLAWYPNAYYGERNLRFLKPVELLVRSFRRTRARWIRNHSTLGIALDVGCGRGQLLAALRNLGYEVLGIELSEQAARHAREVVGAQVEVGDLRTLPYPERSIDVLIFWHSLEHLNQPFEAITRAAELLKEGGTLVIAVPNSDSFQARLTGANWFHLDTPRHRFHFSLQSLQKALRTLGFNIETVRHLGLEQNPFGVLQSLFNALGFEHNLLYSCLKNRSARNHSLQHFKLQLLLLGLSLPVMAPVSTLIWLVESLAKRGGTIEIISRKPVRDLPSRPKGAVE